LADKECAEVPVTLLLHGALAYPARAPRAVCAASGPTLLDLLRAAGLADGSYALLVLDGALVSAQTVPADGDVVDVYPPLCGG
jgi:hypothetical protein